MAITEHASGTRTAGTPPEASFTALGTASDTTTGVFQFHINLKNMADGDEVVIQVLSKTISTDTENVLIEAKLSNKQTEPVWPSHDLVLMHAWTLQIKQTAGTARSFPWSQRKVA